MRLVYNSNSTMHLPVLQQIRLAKETGWDGIFVREEHLRRYLGLGYSGASLREALAGLGAGEPRRAAGRRALASGRSRGDAPRGRGAHRAGRHRRCLVRPAAERAGPAGRRLSRAGPAVEGGAASGHRRCAAIGRRSRSGPRDPLLPRTARLDGARPARGGRRGRRGGGARQRRPRPRLLAPVAIGRDAGPDRPARPPVRSSGSISRTRSARWARRLPTSARAASGRAMARSPWPSGSPRSGRPASMAGGTMSCTARSTGNWPIRSGSRQACSRCSGELLGDWTASPAG